jgi:hypothetical protein
LVLAKARYDLIAALAARRLASGRDPAALAALETTTTHDHISKDTDR